MGRDNSNPSLPMACAMGEGPPNLYREGGRGVPFNVFDMNELTFRFHGIRPRRIRRQKTPHYGWAPPRRFLENRTPNPIRHHP